MSSCSYHPIQRFHMRKKIILIISLIIAVAALGVSSGSAGDPDAVVGNWMVPAKDGTVQIYKCGNLYCGKLSWLKTPGDKDTNNPDPAKRNDLLLNKVILHSFRYDGDEWVKGKIYDPNDGKTYSCLMWMDGYNRLYVKGYIGISLIGRKELWTRVNK